MVRRRKVTKIFWETVSKRFCKKASTRRGFCCGPETTGMSRPEGEK